MAFAGAAGPRRSRAVGIGFVVLFLVSLPAAELVLPLNDESLHRGRRCLKPVFAHTTWAADFYVRKTVRAVAWVEPESLLTVVLEPTGMPSGADNGPAFTGPLIG